MQPIIEDIVQRFAKYPWAEYEHTDDSITYLPPDKDGFKVSLIVVQHHQRTIHSVFFNGLHEEFGGDEEALDWFRLGLSVHCKLHEFSRSGRPYRWILEKQRWSEWVFNWEIVQYTNPAAWMWWIKPQVRVLRNHLLNADDGPAAASVRK